MLKGYFHSEKVVRSLFLALVAVMGFIASPSVAADDDASVAKDPTAGSSEKGPSGASKTESKALLKERKKRGGVVYQEYATVIHTKRLRSEFTPAQWKTILLQKRVRVPLTARDHRDLLLLFVGE